MIRFPSGEKRGSASGFESCVSCWGSLPLACIFQIFNVPLRSLTKTIVPLSWAGSILPDLEQEGTPAGDGEEAIDRLPLLPFSSLLCSCLWVSPTPFAGSPSRFSRDATFPRLSQLRARRKP